jgi:hypothetical protein
MDRRAIAREGRRAQALDALEFERDRESALLSQIAEIVLEQEGRHVDEEAFARLSPEDVGRVREALRHDEDALPGEEPLYADGETLVTFEDDVHDGTEDELARLGAEIELCRARQGALERYVRALVEPAPEGPPVA